MAGLLQAYRARVASGELAADPAQSAAAERLDALLTDVERYMRPGLFGGKRAAPRGLYLHGPVGRGKSMLMDLFFEHAPGPRKRRAHFHEFMLDQHKIMAAARARGGLGQDELIAIAARAVTERTRVLCFDEFAVTDIADAMILGRLFERFFAAKIVIVATSNRAPDDLYRNGINRQLFTPFIDLVKARMDVFALDGGGDHRRTMLLQAPVYYAPLGPAADEAMDAAWERLTFGARPREAQVEVQGRVVRVARQAAGVARFTFDELCRQPLGAADYLALAERFETLLLEGVPKLTPSMREEAARFRILVDVLYEAKAKVVLSADAQPDALYPSGDQSFEFERTASRLIEMRSRAYLEAARRDQAWRDGAEANTGEA